MISVKDAFKKFAKQLELTKGEQNDASRRQQEIRTHLKTKFDVERDFLTGSYARYTKTKPLKDVDIFCVLGEQDRHYRDEPPSSVLGEFESALSGKYGESNVKQQRRSVCIDFGVSGQTERVMSFDVVPAFSKSDHYEIPDTKSVDGHFLKRSD